MIFVTGGTGLVGTNVVRKLVGRGEKIKVLCRKTSNMMGFRDLKNIEFAEGDVTNYDSVREGMKGCTHVYHVAGCVDMSRFNRERVFSVNAGGTENVCRAALEHSVKRLVHTSSTSATATGTKQNPAAEDAAYNFGHLNSPYHDSKKKAEDIVLSYVQKGLDAVMVNPSTMFGEWDIKPSSGKIILYAARFGIPVYPGGSNNFMDVDDAAEGHLLAMEKGKTGERYILGNENLSYKEFTSKICRVLKKPMPSLPLFYPAVYPLGWVGDILGKFFPKTFEDFNSNTFRLSFHNHCVSAEKAKKELGMPQHPIEEAIEKAYAWFKKYNYI